MVRNVFHEKNLFAGDEPVVTAFDDEPLATGRLFRIDRKHVAPCRLGKVKRDPLRENNATDRGRQNRVDADVRPVRGHLSAQIGREPGVRVKSIFIDVSAPVSAGCIDDMAKPDKRSRFLKRLVDFRSCHLSASEISSRIRFAASTGVFMEEGGRRIGRPITSCVAPARMASEGVRVRF